VSKGNLRPWKKGQSGNPSGISKARAEFRMLFEEVMQEETKWGKASMSIGEAAIRVLVDAALKKRERWAVMFIVERLAPKNLVLEHNSGAELDSFLETLIANHTKPSLGAVGKQ
jgi:hypothetical protein